MITQLATFPINLHTAVGAVSPGACLRETSGGEEEVNGEKENGDSGMNLTYIIIG